ncbi:MAG: hypothetical protein K2Q01_08970 [Rickettsiales bacterium]|nr:hypothetical protein [Rickettsiales bacterium]
MTDFPKKTTTDWQKLAVKDLGTDKAGNPVPPESLNWQTPEGIDVKPLYTAADL